MLEMDLGQQRSFFIVHCRVFRGWQVENQSTPITLIVRIDRLSKLFQKDRHDHWDPGTVVCVEGFDMFAEDSRMVLASADQAKLAEHVGDNLVCP